MLVVHGLYSPDRGAGLWAEDPARPVKSTAATQRARSHPFAAPLPGAGATAEALLLLPSLPSAPLDSPELLRTPPRPAPRGAPALLPWRVPVLWLDAGQAVRLLGDSGGGDVRFGRSVEYLAAVVAFASDLVDRGRVLPTVDLLETGAVARWRPIVQGPDLLALHRLAAAMPPVCRAEAEGSSDRDGRDPHTLVSAAVDAFVDAVVRSRLAGARPTEELGAARPVSPAEQPLDLRPPRRGRARRTVVEAWLAGLTSWDGVVDGPDDAVDELAAALAPWDEVGPASGTARLTLRLQAPGPDGPAIDDEVADDHGVEQSRGADDQRGDDRDTQDRAWRLEFFLQSTEDPSLLVPAEQVWEGGGSLGRWLDRPEELLLTELGRAGRIYPDLNTALHQARPSHWELDAVGAHGFLADVAPQLDAAGIGLLLPAWWSRRHRLSLRLSAGTPIEGVVEGAARFGRAQLVDFRWQIAIGDEVLSEDELRALAEAKSPLVRVRGQWLAADPEQLRRGLDFLQRKGSGRMTAGQVLDLAARQDIGLDTPVPVEEVSAEGWLGALLSGAAEDVITDIEPSPDFLAVLRPYQQRGFAYLSFMSRLGLGTCLADDMGLGKTIQVLSLLLVLRSSSQGKRRPSLLVAPASLLANWAAEIERFAPGLKFLIAHTSVMPADDLASLTPARLADVDFVITSYGSLLRIPWLVTTEWNLAVLDEAQAIKNPGAKQTHAAKKLAARARIALTGTPIENRLGDLWSIFDFCNPGLLGSAKEFTAYSKGLADEPHNPFGPLRELVRPYILRRLKTDKKVISDLPDKTEVKAFCQLSRRQAALYQQAVEDLAEQLEDAEGIRRKGLVLSFLMRFKQICNHPSQWLGDGAWAEDDSGKWARLRELSEVIAAKQEKALVFTQFREVTAPLAAFLGEVFGRPGLVLHGETEVKKRKDLVRRFQEDESVPFFVLSLKAGGSGLNLTAAAHVVHFDRWWNPAVENQATDRAFRIGQTKNVLVHKFVCRGTIEEKIDELIESKKQLARDLLEGGGELNLTELADDELLRLVALDLKAAVKE